MSDINFIDAESDYKSENTSFREIVMRHVERISKLSACEIWHGGHYESQINRNSTRDVWVPDGKDIYCNAVQALADMLYAFYDDEMSEDEKAFETNIKEIRKIWYIPSESDKSMVYLPERNILPFQMARYKAHTKYFRNLCAFLRRKRFLDVGAIEE